MTTTPRNTVGPRFTTLTFEPLTKEEQQLVTDNIDWAHYYVRLRYGSRKYIQSDLITVAYIALMRAVKTYDPEKGKFTTYSRWWLRDYLNRDIKWFWRPVEDNECSGDAALLAADYMCCQAGPQQSAIDNEETKALKKLIRKYMRVLTKKQRNVLRDVYLKGITVSEVARRESKTRQCIDFRRLGALSKLREKYTRPIGLN